MPVFDEDASGPPDQVVEQAVEQPADEDPPLTEVVAAPEPPEEVGPRPVVADTPADDWRPVSGHEEQQLSMDLNFDAHGDGDYLHTDPALLGDVERMIVALHVVPVQGEFGGAALAKACESVHLSLGEMSIFHHRDRERGQVLFSMASMVEPGTFPPDGLEGFRCPGLTLFTQLPGARDGVEIYDTMLSAAETLARLLKGKVLDERRNRLTRQMQEHLRETIIEHRRRVNLTRSRR